jgi:subtilisin family serine protease
MFHPLGRFWMAALLALAALGLPTRAAPTAAAPARPTDHKIAPWVWRHTAKNQEAEFLVVLTQQADLSGAEALLTKQEKGRYVVAQLRAAAQASQDPLLQWLARQGVPHRAFYISNAVWVKGDLALAQTLAARPDVAQVDGNPTMTGISAGPAAGWTARIVAPAGIEPNIAYVNADDVWALGITGQGIVLGAQDTGYAWDHPALQPHYRGWDGATADHDYNWHDAIHASGGDCPADSPEPCDDYNHGTHTLGTAVGDDGEENQIGMAPGAEWIGCRNMQEGVGTPATYLECFEFFLAPYPVGGDPLTDGNPDLAPHVTNNSWSCPDSEGCNTTSLLAAVQAQRAAGIFTVVSAGNTGLFGCSSLSEPPAIHPEVYTVGALNTGADTIANFSARGPVTADGSNRREPDLTAPGTNILSSINGGVYQGGWQGTSMAAPHVAGAVALIWSARPGLIGQVALTELILNATAAHIPSSSCGSSGWPNNTFGYGRLDALAAVLNAPAGAGVLAVAVADSDTAAPVPGAWITATLSPTPTLSLSGLGDPAGYLTQTVFSGAYTLTVTAPGYRPATLGGITVTQGLTTTANIALIPLQLQYLPLLMTADEAGAQLGLRPNHSAPSQIGP